MRRDRGQYRHRVTLEILASPTVSPSGQKVKVWATVGTYWASVRPASGRETENADRLKATATHIVTMPYTQALSPATHRLIFKGRILNIQTAMNYDERNREYLLTCIEVVNPQS